MGFEEAHCLQDIRTRLNKKTISTLIFDDGKIKLAELTPKRIVEDFQL